MPTTACRKSTCRWNSTRAMRRHWPFIGSVVDYLERAKAARARPRADQHRPALPVQHAPRRRSARAGPYAAFLGGAYNPIWTEFHRPGHRGTSSRRCATEAWTWPSRTWASPPTAASSWPAAGSLPADMTLDRLDRRRSLLEQLEQSRRAPDDGERHRPRRSLSRHGLRPDRFGKDPHGF